MRLDKYLKAARILKRRTVSNAVAKQNKVLVNGKLAKPAKEIAVDDLITIHFGNRRLTVRVLSVTPAKAASEELMYEIKETVYLKDEKTD